MIERPKQLPDKSVAVWQSYLNEYKRMREEHGFNDDWTAPDANPPVPLPVVRAHEMEKLHEEVRQKNLRILELEKRIEGFAKEKQEAMDNLDRRWRLTLIEEMRVKSELHERVAKLEKENAALRDEMKSRPKTFKRIRV